VLVKSWYFFLVSFFFVACANGQWISLTTENSPKKGGEYALTAAKGKLYLLGGRGVIPVTEYDPHTRVWSEKAYPPIELHHFQALSYKNKIYVIGAFTGNYPTDTPVSNIYHYDIKTNVWQQDMEIPVTRRRGAAALVEHKNKFYLVGGIVNGHLNQSVNWLDEYNPRTKQWTVLPDMPLPRDHIQAAVVDGKIVVAGGRQSSEETHEPYERSVVTTTIYDIKKRKWEALDANANIPVARSGFAAIAYKNTFLVLGGESKQVGAADKTVHNDADSFNIKTKKWEKFPSLLTPNHGFQAAVIGTTVYVSAASDRPATIEFIELR
jgi:N-acetylneuraminic acid mutarotase